MKFSVILPVFNREKSVIDAVNSVINQSFSDWELIIIDDGSQDQTYDVCCDLAEKESHIIVLRQTNQGVSAARNHGLHIASGEYILFLDSDDRLVPNAMEELNHSILSFDSPDIVCFGFSRASGKLWLPEQSICEIQNVQEIKAHFLPDHLNLVPHAKYFLQPFVWNKCYRRTFLTMHELEFDVQRKTWEDSIFFRECLVKAESLYLIRQVLYEMGDSGLNDHLGAHYDEAVLINFIQSCDETEKKYGKRYAFDKPYPSMYNLELLCFILQRLRRSEEFDRSVDSVFCNSLVRKWTIKAGVWSPHTALIKAAFLTKNKWLLRQALADDRHIMRRLLRHIKKSVKGAIRHV